MDMGRWRERARQQEGMLSVRQLGELAVPRAVIRHKLNSERWTQHTSQVLSTSTGPLTDRQRLWLAVLHAGDDSLIGGVAAARLHGLRNWHRDEITVLVAHKHTFDRVPGVRFVRTRRPLADLRGTPRGTLPVCSLEPAALLFAAREPNARTAQGILAALVQQRLTTPVDITKWIERLQPIRRSQLFKRLMLDLTDGAQSLAEVDVRRMCRRYGLPLPRSQRPRRDREGRRRYTDCEWLLADGRTLVLEVDGAFHTEVEHWGDDLRRQRKLTTTSRVVVRCTAIEVRDDPGAVAEDLVALGVRRLGA